MHYLKLQIKTQLLDTGKSIREAFRKMGGAGDGEISKYEFKACMRNNHIGIGNEKIVDMLYRQIDADKSGAITFKEFAEVMNKDEHADNNSNWFVGGGHARNKKKRNNVASIG